MRCRRPLKPPTALCCGGFIFVLKGTLPMKAAAEVCERGARFFTLELSLRPELRGRELGADEMNQLECRLVEYKVVRCAPMCAEDI